jgi:hypothetical protein
MIGNKNGQIFKSKSIDDLLITSRLEVLRFKYSPIFKAFLSLYKSIPLKFSSKIRPLLEDKKRMVH